jgi:hypothetical protein
MQWMKAVLGVVLLLVGGTWMGQGVGILPGSVMSGQMMWAIVGLALVVVGVWLITTFVRSRGSVGATRL